MPNPKTIQNFVADQSRFSEETFGPGSRAEGICKHIEKELGEIRSTPDDLLEWIDVITLGTDGAWRCLRNRYPWMNAEQLGELVADALVYKHGVNRKRIWPDWRQQNPEGPIEHKREGETSTTGQHSPHPINAPMEAASVTCHVCRGSGRMEYNRGFRRCESCGGKGSYLRAAPVDVSRETPSVRPVLVEKAHELKTLLETVNKAGPGWQAAARQASALHERLVLLHSNIPDDSFGNGY